MDRAQHAFISRLGHAAETDGLSPIAGRLFALLLLSEAPRSLDDVAEALQVSKASISTEARRLLERGVIERIRHPGDRRDYYELAPDFFVQTIQSRVMKWRRMQTLADGMRETSKNLPAVVRERLASIDEINAAVIDRVDEALTDWRRRAEKRAVSMSRRRNSA